MAGKVAGFTLIEILVTIFILGVLFAIAVPSYTYWQNERQLTSDVREVYAFVQQERTKAYSTSQEIELTISGTKQICSDKGRCVRTKHDFEAGHSSISISSNGIFDTSWIGIEDGGLLDKYNPRYSCIKIASTRIRLGHYESGNCTAE